MKKQYTTKEAYEGNTKVTFYKDGSEVGYNVVADYNLSGYLEAKEEDGWEKPIPMRKWNIPLLKLQILKSHLLGGRNALKRLRII